MGELEHIVEPLLDNSKGTKMSVRATDYMLDSIFAIGAAFGISGYITEEPALLITGFFIGTAGLSARAAVGLVRMSIRHYYGRNLD